MMGKMTLIRISLYVVLCPVGIVNIVITNAAVFYNSSTAKEYRTTPRVLDTARDII